MPISSQGGAHTASNCALFGEVLVDVFPDKSVIGGAPFNVARHLQALGEHPVLISRLGNDALGKRVMSEFSAHEMNTLGVQCSNRHPTGQVQVRLTSDGHHFDILPRQAYDFIHPSVARMISLSVNPKLVYFGTLAQRGEISSRALKALMRSTSAMKFLDINLRAPWYQKNILERSLHYANVVKLNKEELELLAGMFELEGVNAQAQGRELLNRFDLNQVLVTCGEEGAWLINQNNKAVTSPAHPLINSVDTVGAGDGFAAVFILGTLRGWPMPVTLNRANSFASAVCGIRGAVPEQDVFYTPFIEEWDI